MSDDLDESFAKLLARQPTDTERQRLYQVRDALRIKDNDALWLILMALEHHRTLYETIPNAIGETAKTVLVDVRNAADVEIRASAETTKADLARAVATAASEVARNTSRKQLWQWAVAALAMALFTVTAVGVLAFSRGRTAGYQQGLTETRDEKAAAAWANTTEGQLAYRLAKTSSLRDLATCRGSGWQAENGVCFVRVAADGNIHGWRLPRLE
jgi:hypothetical protein